MYRAQVDSASTDGHGYYMLGLANWKAGDFAGAKSAFDQAIALSPQFAKAYFNQGRVLLDLDRASEALEAIAQGRAIDPESSEGWRLVARAQAEEGDVDAAIATYRELLVRDESDAWGLNNLGMLLFERGDVAGALGPLARAVQVRPTAPLFLNNLGMVLERSGYPVAALRRYTLAVQHDSSYTKAVRNVERLTAVVTDPTVGDEVDVRGVAEAYRQVVRSWAVEVPSP
jgi:tetratricopeptide (TPR) repeat protein